MGIWATATLVKKENGKSIRIPYEEMPEAFPLYQLAELANSGKFRNSLIQIADPELDLSFFDTMGDSKLYGKSFSPQEVLKSIRLIKAAFATNEDQFIQPIRFEGLFTSEGEKIPIVFVENELLIPVKQPNFFMRLFQKPKLPKKKTVYNWAQVRAYPDKIILAHWDESTRKYIEKENALTDNPKLFKVDYDENNGRIIGQPLELKSRKIKYFDELKPELDNVEALAVFAKGNGFEMKIVIE